MISPSFYATKWASIATDLRPWAFSLHHQPSEDRLRPPAPAKEKSAFDVKLEKFDPSAKLKVIKEIRSVTDLGLKEGKDLVEKVPAVVKKGITKEEAEKILEKLKGVGATAVLE